MKNQIFIDSESKKAMMQNDELRFNTVSVLDALEGVDDTALMRAIRFIAINFYGGKETDFPGKDRRSKRRNAL